MPHPATNYRDAATLLAISPSRIGQVTPRRAVRRRRPSGSD